MSLFHYQGGASPADLPAYLQSIGKADWYGIYVPGYQMFANSDGSGGAVADGGAVGYWGPRYQVSFDFKFIQSTSANRPLYSTTLSGIGPTISGNGSSWSLGLNSTTALNLDCSIICWYENTNSTGYVWTQNLDGWSHYVRLNSRPDNYYAGSLETGEALTRAESLVSNGTWIRDRRIVQSSGVSTSRYGTAMRLFNSGLGGSIGSHRIAYLAFVPKLTAAECVKALEYVR